MTLEQVVARFANLYAWQGLARRFRISCCKTGAAMKSSKTLLRKASSARDNAESLPIASFAEVKP